RLRADDRRSRPIDIVGAWGEESRGTPAEEWREPMHATFLGTSNGKSRYRLDVPAGTPIEKLVLEVDDPAFARAVVLYDSRTENSRREEIRLGEKRLFRL